MITTTPFPRVGQVWVAEPRGDGPPFLSWKRFVLITEIDEKQNKARVRKVEKQDGRWVVVGKRSTARLTRFDGGYWNYGFVGWRS